MLTLLHCGDYHFSLASSELQCQERQREQPNQHRIGNQQMSVPPLLGELTTEEFRQKLAGLIDPQEQATPERRQELKDLSIQFAATLPEVFGEDLDRKTMWDRIGTGLQAAFAKTAGDDHEFFIQQVLEHIKAEPSKASINDSLGQVIATLAVWSSSNRQAWITYFNTYLIPILVHARAGWTKTKETRKAAKGKGRNAQDPETLKSFVDTEGGEA